MSVANISTTLPDTVSAALPARTADPVAGRTRKRDHDDVGMPGIPASDQTAQSGGLADRFEPSPLVTLGGGNSAKAASSQASKEEKAKAFERELAAIQQAAAQTRYGVSGQGSSVSLQRDFESLLMAVSSGNLSAAEQALTRLQGVSSETNTAPASNTESSVPLPHTTSSVSSDTLGMSETGNM